MEEWLKYVAKTTGADVKLQDKPRKTSFTHPGLNYLALYPDGTPDVISVLKLVEDIENFAYNSGNSWKRLNNNGLTFVAAIEYRISRPMYFKHVSKWPLKGEITYFGAGKTSFSHKILAFLPDAQEPIISQISKVVFVDPETRRPKLLPDWFKNFVGVRDKSMQDLKIKEFSRPAETFMRQVKVMWTDIDSNNHTNFLSYVKHGMDTLKMALYEGSSSYMTSGRNVNVLPTGGHQISTNNDTPVFHTQMISQHSDNSIPKNKAPFKWITKDIVQNGAKKMSIVFLNESLEGDLLNVHVWQEQGEELTVRCSVESLDHTPLCQFVTTFYGPSHQL